MIKVFIFYSIPWVIILLFYGTCNFKNPNKLIVSAVWLISSKIIGILCAGGWVASSIYALEFREDYQHWLAILYGATGYYFASAILLQMGRDLKNKKVINVKNDDSTRRDPG